jgi:hypothetical protein
LTKAIRSEGKSCKKHLYQFLLNYRATPHITTEFAPAELLFSRKIQTKNSLIANPSEVWKNVQQNDDTAKSRKMMARNPGQKSQALKLVTK